MRALRRVSRTVKVEGECRVESAEMEIAASRGADMGWFREEGWMKLVRFSSARAETVERRKLAR